MDNIDSWMLKIRDRIENLSTLKLFSPELETDYCVHVEIGKLKNHVLISESVDVSKYCRNLLNMLEAKILPNIKKFEYLEEISENEGANIFGTREEKWLRTEIKQYQTGLRELIEISSKSANSADLSYPVLVNITQEELGILMRLMYDTELINNTVDKKQVAKAFSNTFQTKKRAKLSEESLNQIFGNGSWPYQKEDKVRDLLEKMITRLEQIKLERRKRN